MNRLSQIFLIAAALYAVVVLAVFPRWTVDDAYIYYRYAQNLAEAGELNWNPGEDPVEGYTGVAMPVVLAGAIKLGGDPLIASKVIGLAGYAMAALMMMLCLAQLRVGSLPRSVAVGFFLTAPIYFTHAWSGLETMWFAAGVTASLWALLNTISNRPGANAWHHRQRREFVLAVVLLMTSLVRPEGVALAFFFGVALLWVRHREGRVAASGSLLRFAGFYGAPALAYFVWRWTYYGHPLPNTFYAKSAVATLDPRSLSTLARFAFTYLAVPTALGVLIRVWIRRGHGGPPEASQNGIRAPWKPESIAFLATCCFVAVAWLQYARSVPFMNYSFRFYSPYLPVLLVGIALFIDRSLKHHIHANIMNVSAVGFSALVALQLAMNVYGLPGEIAYAHRYKTILENVHARAADYIGSLGLDDERMIVYVDAGVIPYMTGLDTVDFGGLNDETLAHAGRNEPSSESVKNVRAVEYFFSQDAGVVVMTSLSDSEIEVGGLGSIIVDDPRFERYRLVRRFGTRETRIRARDHEFVFLREDLAESIDLETRVAQQMTRTPDTI